MTAQEPLEPLVNLHEIASEMRAQDHGTGGRISRVLVNFPELRVQVISLTAGTHIPEHQVADPITVQLLAGRVRMFANNQSYDFTVGSILSLDGGVTHDVSAIEDSAILVTMVRNISK